MCWATLNNRDKEMRVADEDITVFKVMRKIQNGVYSSYYMEYPYTLGKTYEMNGLKSHKWKDGYVTIEKGFHSYSMECHICAIYNDSEQNHKQIYITQRDTMGMIGVYQYTYDICIVECKIPKGSIYYRNSYDEIVSEKIIINKEISREEW